MEEKPLPAHSCRCVGAQRHINQKRKESTQSGSGALSRVSCCNTFLTPCTFYTGNPVKHPQSWIAKGWCRSKQERKKGKTTTPRETTENAAPADLRSHRHDNTPQGCRTGCRSSVAAAAMVPGSRCFAEGRQKRMELGSRPVTREQLEADPANGRETGAALKSHQTQRSLGYGTTESRLAGPRKGNGDGPEAALWDAKPDAGAHQAALKPGQDAAAVAAAALRAPRNPHIPGARSLLLLWRASKCGFITPKEDCAGERLRPCPPRAMPRFPWRGPRRDDPALTVVQCSELSLCCVRAWLLAAPSPETPRGWIPRSLGPGFQLPKAGSPDSTPSHGPNPLQHHHFISRDAPQLTRRTDPLPAALFSVTRESFLGSCACCASSPLPSRSSLRVSIPPELPLDGVPL
jgi:hypothetical protein